MWGQCVKAQQRRDNGEEVAKWEKAAQTVGARAIKDTGEAGKNVNMKIARPDHTDLFPLSPMGPKEKAGKEPAWSDIHV